MKTQGGFTFIEVLAAMALFAFLAMGSMTLYSSVSKEGDRVMSVTGRNIENEQMIERLTQPVYFGLLSDYPENTALKECISADGKLCDTSKDYPLTAMNLSTKKPMESISGSLAEGIRNTLSFRVHCPLNQASCDQADYFVVKAQTEIAKENSSPYAIEKTAMVVPEITNVATFIPDATLSPGRSINVVLFLDNSNSMLYAKDRIKAGLDSLVGTLGTLNARIAIYNLNYNFTWNYTYYTLSGTTRTDFSILDIPNIPGNTVYYEEIARPYSYGASWTPTNAFYGMVDLKSEDTAAQRTQKVQAISTKIEKLFASGAPAADRPLCQMLEIIQSQNQLIPINSDVPTVFILLTNENDEGHLIANVAGSTNSNFSYDDKECYKSITNKRQKSPSQYNYNGVRQWNTFSVTADWIVDGAPATKNIDASVPFDVYDSTIATGSDCLAKQAALDDKIKVAINHPGYGTGFTGTYTAKKCVVQAVSFWMELSSSPDKCTNEEAAIKTKYPYYTPGSCTRSDWASSSNFLKIESVVPIVPWTSSAFTNQDVAQAVYNELASKNALNTTNVISIVHKASEASSCPLTAGAEFGTKYEKLANMMDKRGSVISICESDYGSKLAEVTKEFLDTMGASDIDIPASVAASLKSVEVVRGSTTLKPVKDQDYKLYNSTLMFTPGYLKPTDIVKVFTQ